ncbi:hypothetical protein [Gynurincola endophyticus]|uniref:hypothetical protein n=1 Tax=Gynurincola endophyticus TaxID=2479004 RepID=UPI000F8EE318|nr:hypothetical protein [Gynurincola endophyticus]
MSKLYTAEYIYKYIKGELSKEETYLLEKSALSDPFLLDMINGYEVAFKKFGHAKVQEYLQNIKHASTPGTTNRFKNKKKLLIAAGITGLLILSVILSWNQLNSKITLTESVPDQPVVEQSGSVTVNELVLETYSLEIKLSDEQGQPLVQKDISIYNKHYKTDNNGKINIRPLKAGTNFSVDIPGFKSVQISIPKGHHETVLIQVEAENGIPKTSTLPKEKMYAPEGGWYKFQKFVDDNKQLPIDNQFLKGTVVIKASLSSTNILSGFEVTQSLNTKYDEEAIRLIKTYDGWKNKMSAPIVVYLEVNF